MYKIINFISNYWISVCLFPLFLIYIYFRYFNILIILLSKFIGYTLIIKNKIINFLKKFTLKNFKIRYIIIIHNNNFIYLKNFNDIYNYNEIDSIFIAYMINNKEYYIIHSIEDKFNDFKFPIYTYEETIKKNPFDQTNDDIIYININYINNLNIDHNITNKITEIIKKFSGPKGSFYIEKNYDINYKKSYIIKYINKKFNINLNYNKKFNILYSNGNKKII